MKLEKLNDSFNLTKNTHTSRFFRIETESTEFTRRFLEFQESTKKWADTVAFRDLRSAKNLNKIYIDLDLYLTPAKLHLDFSEKSDKVSMETTLLNLETNAVILGQPGAGKTTSMKRLYQLLSTKTNEESQQTPLVIRLRDLKEFEYSFFSFLLQSFVPSIIIYEDSRELNIEDFNGEESIQLVNDSRVRNANLREDRIELVRFISKLIENCGILLILDGYDEVPGEFQQTIVTELTDLTKHLAQSKFILTSRSNDFDINLDNSVEFEICPLTEEQLKKFSHNWLLPESKAQEFIKQIKTSPYYDTMIRPLSLSHLCAIYERIGKIPDKPKTIHRKIVGLLIEEWDEQREVNRNSIYDNFEQDRKFEFLANFAFLLTVKYNTTTFTKEQLEIIYSGFHANFGLPMYDLKNVVREIETHTGIIVCISRDEYEFAHKSTQEYLTGEYLVKLPSIPTNVRTLLKLPNELAIAVSLSSSASLYLTSIIQGRISPLVSHMFRSKGSLKTLLIQTPKIPPRHKVEFNDLSNFIVTFCGRLLIEKPDIPRTSVISVSLILLGNLLSKKKRNITYRLFRHFGDLAHLKKYYDVELETGIYYLKLRGIKTINDYKLPKILFIDAEFFDQVNEFKT